jgi:hypothetical protein
MRSIDGDKFYSLIKKHCEQSENFGIDILHPLSNLKSDLLCSSQKLKEDDVKDWFKNLAILALTINKLCYKSQSMPLGNSGFTTVNGGSIAQNLIPEVTKIKLSKKDMAAFTEIHYSIKEHTNDIRKLLTHFEKNKEFSIPTSKLTDFSIYAMEIPQKIYAVCRGEFYHFNL